MSKSAFLCYAKKDMDAALSLCDVLLVNNLLASCEQGELEAADATTRIIRNARQYDDQVVLLWSRLAANIPAVADLVKKVWEEGIRLLPYCLDRTPLQHGLDEMVFIDAKDDAAKDHMVLLSMVTDFQFTVPAAPSGIVPGTYTMQIKAFGVGSVYQFQLFPNGRVQGHGNFAGNPTLSKVANMFGLGNLLNQDIPVVGQWGFDPQQNIFGLRVVANLMGQTHQDTFQINIQPSGQNQWLGTDGIGRNYTLSRRG